MRGLGRRSVVVAAALCAAMATTPVVGAAKTYRQPLSKVWHTASIDILVVPPGFGQVVNGNGVLNGGDTREADAFANSHLRAIEDSIADWRRAIGAYGPRWLRQGLKIETYVLGTDDVPQRALTEPHIVVMADATKGPVLGMAVYLGRSCVVSNSRFFASSFTYADMYNINLHEVGHCLGLDHNFAANGSPEPLRQDVMNEYYQEPVGAAGTPKHCPSNLNVRGIGESFRPAIRGEPASLSPAIPRSSYRLKVVAATSRCFG